MSDTLRDVTTGEQIRMSASRHNALNRMLRDQAQANAAGRPPQIGPQHGGTVLVKNASGTDKNSLDVMVISSSLIDPTTDAETLAEWKRRVVLVVHAPTTDSSGPRWVILAEPIPAGEIGRAYIGGVVPAKVTVVADEGTRSARLDGTVLKATDGAGDALILWIYSTSAGEQYAILRIGDTLPKPTTRGKAIVVNEDGDQWIEDLVPFVPEST